MFDEANELVLMDQVDQSEGRMDHLIDD